MATKPTPPPPPRSRRKKDPPAPLIVSVPEFLARANWSRRTFERARKDYQRPRVVQMTPGRKGVPVSELEALLEGTLFERDEA